MSTVQTPPQASIITDPALGPAAKHGLKKLLVALDSRGVEQPATLDQALGAELVVAGLADGDGPAAALLAEAGAAPPTKPEALLIKRTQYQGKPALLLAGADDRGLMYAMLEAAAAPLAEVREACEAPATSERALSIYTMHQACFESRFFDPDYWDSYLDMLARQRFNSFVLLFGYENAGYLAPPYPYFFDLDAFPDIRVEGWDAGRQARYLKALNRLVAQTHERGLNFTLGIWDHIYRGGVQGPVERAQKPTNGIVWGLNADNLSEYSVAALARFLELVPDIDALQFRMHGESGLEPEEMAGFWDRMYQVMADTGKDIRFDARAKGFPDALIDLALAKGVNIRICTKYWAEQMGLPFHPSHINVQNQFDRRHGYADLLRQPPRYKVHWRLWNGGTTRVLQWGDPEYVRRFVESTHLYEGDGFEVNEPLATKMASQPHEAPPVELSASASRYYKWEFERYWYFYALFGRLAYNPDTSDEVWEQEFSRRFGAAGPTLQRALHRASQVLPTITAACFPYNSFPTTRGWAEKQRRGDLPDYAKADVSDTEQFLTIREEARNILLGRTSPQTAPSQTSQWFAQTASDVLELAAQAEAQTAAPPTNEFIATIADLRILANLALYHARRIPAGVAWVLYQTTGNTRALDDAIRHEESAIRAWEEIVAAAGDVYSDDLMMGRPEAGLAGHWRDELVELQRGLDELRQRRAEAEPSAPSDELPAPPALRPPPTVVHQPIVGARAGEPLTIIATATDPDGVEWVRLRYRAVNQMHDYRFLPMWPTDEPNVYQAAIPGEHIVPEWDLMYFIEVMGQAGNGGLWPDFERETPYIVVKLTRD